MSNWKETALEYAKTLGTSAILAALIMTFLIQAYRVEGVSMLPTLHNGDRLMIDKVSYRLREPRYGEIVVFRFPANPRQRFIKRVIGLPGDTVEIRQNRVYLNGQVLNEEYLNGTMYGNFGPVVVPENSIFVLGDNRNNSADSRYQEVGPIPDKLIIGRALFQFWPLTKLHVVKIPEIFKVYNSN
jgi:signal peptidase I